MTLRYDEDSIIAVAEETLKMPLYDALEKTGVADNPRYEEAFMTARRLLQGDDRCCQYYSLCWDDVADSLEECEDNEDYHETH